MARSNHRLPKIPEMTIRRLSVYTRCLQQLEEDGVKTVSSQELAGAPDAAQGVTEQLVAAGIKAVLNFAPTRLRVGREVRLKNVDLSIELETLSFYLARGGR